MNLRKGCDTKYGPKLTDCPDPGAWSRLSDTTKADTKSGAPNSLGLIASAKAWCYNTVYRTLWFINADLWVWRNHYTGILSSEFALLYVWVISDQEICQPVLPGEAETMVFRHRCFTAVSGPPSSGTFAQLLFQFFLQASMLHSSFRAAKQWGIPTSTEEDEQVWSPLNNNFHRSKIDLVNLDRPSDNRFDFLTGSPTVQSFRGPHWISQSGPLDESCQVQDPKTFLQS